MNLIEHEKAKEYIKSQLSQEELLAQLAEEAAELAHAALKLRRVYDGTNPTPVDRAAAYSAVKEEVSDVLLLVDLLQLERNNLRELGRIMNTKLERWQQRLSEREKQTPKKPEMKAMEGFAAEVASELCCPNCSGPVTNYWVRGAKPKHCQFCGQALDWGVAEA